MARCAYLRIQSLDLIKHNIQIKMFQKLITILLFSGLISVQSHVRLWAPISRSSIWRDPRFNNFHPEPNYDDDGLYCGQVHQPEIVQDCGICGDGFALPTPRPNEHGGIYGRGIIVENYRSGANVDVEVEFTTTHDGFVIYQICDRIPETEACFQTLELAAGGNKVPVMEDGHQQVIRSTVKLPQGLTCEHCVLRMNYRAGNNWGNCGNGTEGMGCGLQETFRHCSDISIQ